MSESGKYDINFFTPHTPFLRDNIRLIIISVVIWALAVFGFQFLLRIVEKPVPEPGYLVYQQIWPKQFDASPEEKQELAKVYLTLVGKYISLRQNPDIQGDFSRLVYELLPEGQRQAFSSNPVIAAGEGGIDLQTIATAVGVEGTLLQEAIPFSLGKLNMTDSLSPSIPAIMENHLIHNRSFLTDTKFLGFPLHYFYTAVLLKIIFCLICLIYCKLIDGIMKKHGMEAANE